MNPTEIDSILSRAAQQIREHLADAADATPWRLSVDADGNEDVPNDERNVLLFQCGDRGPLAPRPDDAGYGMSIGWFDTEKRHWRVNGQWGSYVTHWREMPTGPKGTT